eukprot:515293_1
MPTVTELLPRVRQHVHELQTQFQYVERGRASPDDIAWGLNELSDEIAALEKIANKERPQQRQNWKRKIRELRSEKEFVATQLDRHNATRYRGTREAREREELMRRRRDVMPSGVEGAYAEEGASLARSTQMVGNYIASGQVAMGSLVDQRGRLKGAQRRVRDIAGLVTASGSILSSAMRRSKVDQLIVLCGMIITTGLLYYAWRYTTG